MPQDDTLLSIPSVATWWVWEDWTCEDVVAVREEDLTPGLHAAFLRERLTPRQVQALSRHEAVRQAFPHRFVEEEHEEPAPGVRPPPRPH